jgi:hypothetical protein
VRASEDIIPYGILYMITEDREEKEEKEDVFFLFLLLFRSLLVVASSFNYMCCLYSCCIRCVCVVVRQFSSIVYFKCIDG